MFEAFHSKDQWSKSLSTTFITLIPKKKDASEVKDFRPISLVGCLYKVLAKTLTIRLKGIIPHVIMNTQNAFLYGKQIMDCSLLENKIIDAMLKAGRTGILCKVDMEKAYDHVNWGYLD